MDLAQENNVQKLQALRGEEFVRREQAQAIIRETEQNIQLLSGRITELNKAETDSQAEVS